jgi:hypothetical protein
MGWEGITIMEQRKKELQMKTFYFFIPDSHMHDRSLCESGLSGPVLAWRGRRHGRNVSDVDELQVLQTGSRNYMINTVLAGNPRAANRERKQPPAAWVANVGGSQGSADRRRWTFFPCH